MSFRRVPVLAFASVGVLATLPLQAAANELSPSDGYRVSVLTIGPGAPFVARFGHDAILVERAGLPSLVYNFGTYTEQAIAPHHVLGGTLLYYLSVDYLGRTIAAYRAQDRSVTQQVLALDQPTAERLARALSWNSEPANTTYHYDFARDNCTTRVRDALDHALGGALHAELRDTSPYTYRDHALRFTADDPVLAFLFDLGLGKNVDRPLEAWDDAFLPDRLAHYLRQASVTDAAGSHPLVSREATLFEAKRAPVPDRPPMRAPLYLLVSATLGMLLARAGRRASLRRVLGLACALVGATLGSLGLFVLLLLATKVHALSHANFNALVCPAWAFALVPAGLAVAFGAAARLRWLAFAASSSLLFAAAGSLVAAAYGQDSARVAALVVPLLSGAWLGVRAALRTA
jgi:Domain of unknown function (DUF4105)